MKLAMLRALGFTGSSHVPFTKTFNVRCPNCAALVVNGHPIHETGCPSAVHECHGCNTLIPVKAKYCGECA